MNGIKPQKKKEIVSKINNTTKNTLSIVVANLKNIKANELTKLRMSAQKIGVKLGVFKNNLIILGIKNTKFECLKELLLGPVLIGYSIDHPRSAAKLFKEFSKSNINFKIIGAVFEEKILSSENINILADIPTYDEALNRLMIIIKETTLGKLMRVLISIRELKNKT
ncbi:MAG: 50S ribosomal protein L10 [Buchnera aphidicola (Floraphis choui)]